MSKSFCNPQFVSFSNHVFSSHTGFTLIEVIVSMVLVSMITLIMAFSLKINLDAWERGNNEGDKVQIEIVMPAMIERQLRYIVSSASLSTADSLSSENSQRADSVFGSKNSSAGAASSAQTGVATQLQFIGNQQSLSFYTLYSPQGTPSQGLVRVGYIYDEDAKELNVYESVISSQEDIDESDGLFSVSGRTGAGKSGRKSWRSALNKSGKKSGGKFSSDSAAIAKIKDVEKFSLSFLAAEDSSYFQNSNTSSFGSSSRSSGLKGRSKRNSSDFKMNGESFQESWDENEPNPPQYLRLLFAQTKRKGGEPSVWLFKVGGNI